MAERARGSGATSLSNLQITERYLSSGYEIVKHDLTRGATDLLRVFSLVPKSAGMPRFDARVDDGTEARPKDPELDIDIRGVSNAIERDFKANRNGYIGHHTDRSPTPNHRIFDVEIATPAGRVFEGSVSFNVAFSLQISMVGTSSVSVNATHIRASWLSKVGAVFRRVYERI